jgi:hypothetical protein
VSLYLAALLLAVTALVGVALFGLALRRLMKKDGMAADVADESRDGGAGADEEADR